MNFLISVGELLKRVGRILNPTLTAVTRPKTSA
jgi:hypothetical protein